MIRLLLLFFGGPAVLTVVLLNVKVKGRASGRNFWIASVTLLALGGGTLIGSLVGAAYCSGELCGLGYALYGGGAALVLLAGALIVAIVSKFVRGSSGKNTP